MRGALLQRVVGRLREGRAGGQAQQGEAQARGGKVHRWGADQGGGW
jgi:hypothetical protein